MMASLIPETVTHLQATAFVSDAELSAIGRDRIIRAEAEKMAEMALRKLLEDCIKTEGDYMGYKGQTLRLDVYVLSRADLHQIIARAREQGEHDAMRWMVPN
jgi:hypothetical protein